MTPERSPRTLLAVVLVERGWTVERFCRVYAETAATLGVHSNGVSIRTAKRWVAGTTQPQPPARRVLTQMFGTPADRLLAPPPRRPPAASVTVRQAALVRPAATYSGNAGDAFPQMGDSAMAAAADDAATFLARAHSASGAADALGILTNEVRRIARAFPTDGGPALIPALASAQRVAFRHLDGPTDDPATVRDFYFLAGATAGMLARAARDIGHLDAAMTHARTALLCADRAGHPGLKLWIRNEQAGSARWAGWYHDALRYTQLADADAPAVRGTAAVAHAYQKARAYAAVGDVDRARVALNLAAAARDRVQPDDLDELGGQLSVSDGDALYIGADAHSFLPDPAAAETAALRALELLSATPETNHGNLHGAYAAVAIARARNGDPDGAREAFRPVLTLPPRHRVYGLLVDVHQLHGILTAPRYHGAQIAHDFATELETFAQEGTPRQATN